LLKIQPRSEAAPVSVFSRTPQHEVHEEVSTRLADRFASKLQEAAAQETMQDAAIAQPKSKSSDEPGTPYHRTAPKVGRNDPCSCGSGLKYKKCHGK
jgi:preprotein translocase subunit SecA